MGVPKASYPPQGEGALGRGGPEGAANMRGGKMLLFSQAYTSKRRILIQVLPVPNVYRKTPNKLIIRFGIRIGDRKYLNEYTPFGSVRRCEIKLINR